LNWTCKKLYIIYIKSNTFFDAFFFFGDFSAKTVIEVEFYKAANQISAFVNVVLFKSCNLQCFTRNRENDFRHWFWQRRRVTIFCIVLYNVTQPYIWKTTRSVWMTFPMWFIFIDKRTKHVRLKCHSLTVRYRICRYCLFVFRFVRFIPFSQLMLKIG